MSAKISGTSIPTKSDIKPDWLTSLGIFLALAWLFITFLQEDPILFLSLGGLNLIIMIYSRFISRKNQGLELEGGITGYLITWLLTFFFYQQKEFVITISSAIKFQVNEVMILYLTVSFLVWFIITPRKTTQEILWNLPPFYSNLLLNLWKFAVISLLLVSIINELNSFATLVTIFFLIVGFTELIIYYYNKQIKVDYIDIILNPLQLLSTIASGPLEALKWVLLTTIFIILGSLELDIGTGALIFCSLFIGLISLSTGITRLFLNSGIIESRVEESKTMIPKVLEEVQQISSSDSLIQFDEFYEVLEQIEIIKRNQVVTILKGDSVIRFPFTQELETQTGVFFFHLNMKKLIKSAKKRSSFKERRTIMIKTNSDQYQKKINESVKNFDFRGSSVHRVSREKWKDIMKDLRKLEREAFAKKIGFKDANELDKELAKLIRGTVIAQEQIRSRLRGVPAPSFRGQKSYTSIIESSGITLPLEMMKNQEISNGQEIEIIPGKNEFLFYVKRKK
ncbi:MAG: hypothetical protein ACW964_05210 [Candidatus Hodarchaeales archaeon]|jgi:hypothetical protein